MIPRRQRHRQASFLLASTLLACVGGCDRKEPATATSNAPALPQHVVGTRHYRIHSNAVRGETDAIGGAMESLHAAYARVFPMHAGRPLEVVLYRDRAEFKRNNRSAPWAEAYYRRPTAFAYPGEGANPHHWVLHEATHQLLAEASGYTLNRWLDEGLASCFGAGTLDPSGLHIDQPDPNAYPAWWLRSVRLESDGLKFDDEPFLRLQDIVEGTGPAVGEHVNHYYVAWWSLALYLLEGDEKAHRQALLQLLREGGDAAAFRKLIGEYAQVEPRWHAYLLQLASAAHHPPTMTNKTHESPHEQ